MERSPELTKGLTEAYLFGLVKVAAWAIPVVASSLLVLWLQQKLLGTSTESVIVVPKLKGSL